MKTTSISYLCALNSIFDVTDDQAFFYTYCIHSRLGKHILFEEPAPKFPTVHA